MEKLQLFIMLFIVAIVVAVMMGVNPLSMLNGRSTSPGSISVSNNAVTPNLNIVASI